MMTKLISESVEYLVTRAAQRAEFHSNTLNTQNGLTAEYITHLYAAQGATVSEAAVQLAMLVRRGLLSKSETTGLYRTTIHPL